MASAVRLPSLTGSRFFLAPRVILFHQSYPWWVFNTFDRGYLTDAAPPFAFFAWPLTPEPVDAWLTERAGR